MPGYGDAMNEAAFTSTGPDTAESRLRDALDRSGAVLAGAGPVLHHLLADDDSGLFGDAVVARVHGMARDVARQLLQRLTSNASGEPQPPEEGAVASLTAAIIDSRAFLSHLHALALEWQITEGLLDRLALDPVLSPLLQALIGSPDAITAALAMKLLAAQARFGQEQRRMRLPIGELPGDLLHGALITLRAVAGVEVAVARAAAAAEAAIRAEYDEARTRLGLAARLVASMGAGALAALSLEHAGAVLFLSALAEELPQDRDRIVLAAAERQQLQLALALCAAGLKPATITAQLLALQPDAELPHDIARLSPDRALALLVAAA